MKVTCTRLPGVSLRDAGAPDADAVMNLIAAVNPGDPEAFKGTREGLVNSPITGPLSHFRNLAVIAEDSSGKSMGTLLGGPPAWLFEHPGVTDPVLQDALVARIGMITAVAVHPDHRGRGVGSELIRHAVRRFTRAGYGLLTLNFFPPLEAYYRGHGFTAMDTLNVNIGEDLMLGQTWGDTRVAAKALDRYTAFASVPGLKSPVVSGIVPGSSVPRGAYFDGRRLRT